MPILKKFFGDTSGNVAVLFALVVAPLLAAVGAGIDYADASAREAQLNGIADAAALSALTPTLLNMASDTPALQQLQHDAMVKQATDFFNAQSPSVPGVSASGGGAIVPTVTATPNGVLWKVDVTYAAVSANVFAQLLAVPNINIGGTSEGTAGGAPNTDFYLMIDTSPSMAIAATSGGITTMVNNTKAQNGCAFGCHEVNPAAESQPLGNPAINNCAGVGSKNGVPGGTSVDGTEDNYFLARCLNVTLRIDLVNQAVQALAAYAPGAAVTNHAAYRGALYTFDYGTHPLVGPALPVLAGPAAVLAGPTSVFTPAQGTPSLESVAGTLAQLEVYKNGCLIAACNSPIGNKDEDTYFDQALSDVSSAMPNPGNGTNNKGDTPQEVLFIVSDAVPDAADSRIGNTGSFYTVSNAAHSDWCSQIKARGIRIAFLYLTYNPLPTNGFYNSEVKPIQPDVGPAAQTCASPGLFFEVNTGGDITAALIALFDKATKSSFLSL